MTDLFQQILDWVALHPYWSGAIIFLVAMAESLAIVGMMIPGVVIMFGIGALIAAGSIEFWPAMIAAVAGAVVGRVVVDRLGEGGLLAGHPELIDRFVREARAQARLDHPNVVHVHSVGSHRGVHYYAMQYIDGQPLDVAIRELRSLAQINPDERAAPAETGPAAVASRPRSDTPRSSTTPRTTTSSTWPRTPAATAAWAAPGSRSPAERASG